ncbi:MAG: DUF4440 domain-containing protein [Micropepsaceae bacterium]
MGARPCPIEARTMTLRFILPVLALAGVALADAADDARATIEHANASWEACIKVMDVDCVVADYAEDGMFILPDGKVIAGKAAVAALYAGAGKPGVTITDAKITSEAIVSAGDDLVYEYGTGHVERTAADGTVTRRDSRYLTVWKRGEDGVWRIIRNLSF